MIWAETARGIFRVYFLYLFRVWCGSNFRQINYPFLPETRQFGEKMLLSERQVVDVHSYPSSSDITSLSKQRKAVTKDIKQRRSESRPSCSKRFPLSRQFIFLLRCQWKLKKIRTVENSALPTNVFAFRCEKRKLFMSRCLVQESKSLRKANETFFSISISGQSKQFHLTYPSPDRFALESESPQLRNAVERHPRIVFYFVRCTDIIRLDVDGLAAKARNAASNDFGMRILDKPVTHRRTNL